MIKDIIKLIKGLFKAGCNNDFIGKRYLTRDLSFFINRSKE